MLFNCLAVGLGGCIGSILRYLCSILIPSATFPWATLAINVLGSFALALFAGLVLKGIIPDGELSLLLTVGLCGGFTTYSTFSMEVFKLASSGDMITAAIYALGTFALCLAATFAGVFIAKA